MLKSVNDNNYLVFICQRVQILDILLDDDCTRAVIIINIFHYNKDAPKTRK